MGFLRYAKATSHHVVPTARSWDRVRVAATERPSFVSPNLIEQASEILGEKFSPDTYLMTHATIVASVDTYDVPGVKTGSFKENGFVLNRKYSNYRVRPECDPWINNNCFVPGTLITMADGTVRPIEDIVVGDEVITHRGRVRKVVHTFHRHIDESIYCISPRGTTERTYATGEHPFFVFRPNSECVGCGTRLRRKTGAISHLLGKFYCGAECYRKVCKTNKELLSEKSGVFVEAKGLKPRDYSSTPVLHETKEVGLTLGQARLLGLFVAEGYYELYSQGGNEKVGVAWGFHVEETQTLAQDVLSLLKSEFGVEGVVREHSRDNGIHVTSRTNRDLVHFFSHWVKGEGSKTKSLHPDLLTAPQDIQMELVRGWFEGDGSFVQTDSDLRLVGATGCRSLANQMQMVLHRLGVSSRLCRSEQEGRKRLLVDGSPKVVSDPAKSTVVWQVSCGGGWVADLVQETLYEEKYLLCVEERGGVQKVPSLRFLNGYHLQAMCEIEVLDYQGLIYNIEVEEDHSYLANGLATHNCDAWERKTLLRSYPTFIGGHNFVEHDQRVENSKGRIIDAVARDIGDSVYIDILVATHRKHRSLVASIESGEMNSMSMGCSIEFSQCTKCGHVAIDETEMCSHVKYEKGNYFYDDMGRRHRIAELCGHYSTDPTGGVNFIEASWVGVPAFGGAQMRNILLPSEISASELRKAQAILMSPPKTWSPEAMEGIAKAASLVAMAKRAQFDFGDDDEDGGDDEEGDGGDKDKGVLSQLEEDARKEVIRRIKKQIEDEISPGEEPVPVDASRKTNQDANLNRQARSRRVMAQLYKDTIHVLVRTASSDANLLRGIAGVNKSFQVKVPEHLYQAALRVGSTNRYSDLEGFIRACKLSLGRTPSPSESRTLVRLGNLLARRSG